MNIKKIILHLLCCCLFEGLLLKAIPKEKSNYVFYDLAKIEPSERIAQSPIIQFYYGGGNVGDCLSVLGTQEMLKIPTDTWSVGDKKIDFDFINKHYKCAILGGGGLFHGAFEHFLRNFLDKCTVPFIIWGVGACLPEKKSGHKAFQKGVDTKLVQDIVKKAKLVNIRDTMTVNVHHLKNVFIAPCPSMVYAQKFLSRNNLYVSHENHTLVPIEEKLKIRETLNHLNKSYKTIDHVAFGNNMSLANIEKMFLDDYCP